MTGKTMALKYDTRDHGDHYCTEDVCVKRKPGGSVYEFKSRGLQFTMDVIEVGYRAARQLITQNPDCEDDPRT